MLTINNTVIGKQYKPTYLDIASVVWSRAASCVLIGATWGRPIEWCGVGFMYDLLCLDLVRDVALPGR